jgi:hypothetical protein
MRLLHSLRVVPLALALLTTAALAVPGERDRLNACKVLVERAGQPQALAAPAPDDAQLQKCRQIIKEWTVRDSRMSIDEQGRPMK